MDTRVVRGSGAALLRVQMWKASDSVWSSWEPWQKDCAPIRCPEEVLWGLWIAVCPKHLKLYTTTVFVLVPVL